jgi:N-acetylmuramic acid 6-phosphate etherase
MTPLEVVTVMNREDELVPKAIAPHLEEIAQVVAWGIESVTAGGRVFYMGAGTSGRLGVLDASECPPTFGVKPDVVVGLIAGGDQAFTKAKEGAEDDKELGRSDLLEHNLTAKDLVIGIAASGRTPYVLGGLEYAKETGCHTAAVTCNADSILGKAAEVGIDIVIGPEVLTGSTRLKAGTAQKMVLNMFSTAIMVGCGKAYSNLMVDVQQTNEKLVARARRIVTQATGVSEEEAAEKIAAAGGSCKTAITMILADVDAEEAKKRLEAAGGHVRKAIQKGTD